MHSKQNISNISEHWLIYYLRYNSKTSNGKRNSMVIWRSKSATVNLSTVMILATLFLQRNGVLKMK